LSWTLIIFGADILVETKGLYFAMKLLPWNEVAEIRDNKFSLMIIGKRSWVRKGFLKVLWRVERGDVEKLIELHKAASRAG